MSDWYDKGYDEVIADVAKAADITKSEAIAVYSALSEYGLIDYDIEKEVFFNLTHDEDGEEYE